ncbi:hypothetical protein TCAL_05664 [Tigriopus californicus]|uniref:ELYS beta-propeller domain-containing protein n=1 Tax=Tigriopus californicus TaxID=6832 RepID=A0A553PAV8_TIGCA|nr:hypothetical protein TCAL_05664 [Tigriopus californicus]
MSHWPTLGSCSSLISFPSCVRQHLSLNAGGQLLSQGSLSPEDQLAFVSQGCHLEVIHAQTNERLAAWTFGPPVVTAGITSPGSNPRILDHEITCVSELMTKAWPNPTGVDPEDAVNRRCAVVGLANGLVCVLDLKSSKVIRAIQMGQRVTALSVVSPMGGPMANHRTMAEELMFFYGIVAVGTLEGHLYLVDLGLDLSSQDVLLDTDHLEADVTSSEKYPAQLHFIAPKNESSRANIADIRQKVMRRGQHLALSLNESSYVNRAFQHVSSATGDSTYFPEESVTVCSLKYIPQLATLAAGFNYGSWQMWNIGRLFLEFSSNYGGPESLPVVEFTFQEPENDPRHFCYIWTMQSENDYDLLSEKLAVNSVSSIALHALSYENRDDGEQYGVLYTGLTSCTPRFEYRLSGNSVTDDEVNNEDFSDADGVSSNLGLAVFLWQVHLKDEPQPEFYFGLFDLNAWYQAQMPSGVDPACTNHCSFLSICPLEDLVLSAKDSLDFGMNPVQLLNIGIDVNSLSRYQSLSNAEQHFFPSALTFEIVALMREGFMYVTNLGLQRKVLLELQTRGRVDLADPQHLHHLCVLSGLVSQDFPGTLSTQEQRSQLLTVALENHLVSLLTGCVWHWKDGKYVNAGCSLKMILDWSWERVTQIKHSIDKVTLPLFDLSCLELNEATRKSLLQSSQQLRHLCSVNEALIKHAGIVTEHGMQDLETKYEVTNLVNQYLEVILWFFNAKLLPELPEEDSNEDPESSNNPYPVALLMSIYKAKRERMKKQLSKYSFNDTPCLIIDGLCDEFGENLHVNFERAGGDGLYPPPTLHALLTMYLINLGTDVNKHRIVQYLFLDIASYLHGDKWAYLIDNLIKFPSAFSVPPSIIKLTQAFWLLDHEDFEEAMTMLSDPLISNQDIADWQHRVILVLFLVQNQPKLALKYSRIRKPPQKDLSDIQLHIAILLANGMVHEAFQYQRNRRNTRNASEMLQHFLEKAEELGKLDSVLQLSLVTVEEKELILFLERSSRPSSQEILLMYYLQRSRYSEAMQLNEKLDTMPGSRETSQTRRAIMERFSRNNLIPNTLMHRFSKATSLSDRLKLNAPNRAFPVPLSLEIKTREFNPIFHASAIQEQMEKKKQELEEQTRAHMAAFTPFRPREQRSLAKRKYSEIPAVVFPKDVSLNESSLSSLNGSVQGDLDVTPPPFKRHRLSEMPPLSAAGKKRMASFRDQPSISAHILSVLETPVINRTKGKRSMAEIVLGKDPPAIATPQSILKVKRLMSAQSPSPASESGAGGVGGARWNFSPEEDPEAESWLMRARQNEASQSRDSTPAKSLRFNVPKKLDIEGGVEDDDVEEGQIVGETKDDDADDVSVEEKKHVQFHIQFSLEEFPEESAKLLALVKNLPEPEDCRMEDAPEAAEQIEAETAKFEEIDPQVAPQPQIVVDDAPVREEDMDEPIEILEPDPLEEALETVENVVEIEVAIEEVPNEVEAEPVENLTVIVEGSGESVEKPLTPPEPPSMGEVSVTEVQDEDGDDEPDSKIELSMMADLAVPNDDGTMAVDQIEVKVQVETHVEVSTPSREVNLEEIQDIIADRERSGTPQSSSGSPNKTKVSWSSRIPRPVAEGQPIRSTTSLSRTLAEEILGEALHDDDEEEETDKSSENVEERNISDDVETEATESHSEVAVEVVQSQTLENVEQEPQLSQTSTEDAEKLNTSSKSSEDANVDDGNTVEKSSDPTLNKADSDEAKEVEKSSSPASSKTSSDEVKEVPSITVSTEEIEFQESSRPSDESIPDAEESEAKRDLPSSRKSSRSSVVQPHEDVVKTPKAKVSQSSLVLEPETSSKRSSRSSRLSVDQESTLDDSPSKPLRRSSRSSRGAPSPSKCDCHPNDSPEKKGPTDTDEPVVRKRGRPRKNDTPIKKASLSRSSRSSITPLAEVHEEEDKMATPAKRASRSSRRSVTPLHEHFEDPGTQSPVKRASRSSRRSVTPLLKAEEEEDVEKEKETESPTKRTSRSSQNSVVRQAEVEKEDEEKDKETGSPFKSTSRSSRRSVTPLLEAEEEGDEEKDKQTESPTERTSRSSQSSVTPQVKVEKEKAPKIGTPSKRTSRSSRRSVTPLPEAQDEKQEEAEVNTAKKQGRPKKDDTPVKPRSRRSSRSETVTPLPDLEEDLEAEIEEQREDPPPIRTRRSSGGSTRGRVSRSNVSVMEALPEVAEEMTEVQDEVHKTPARRSTRSQSNQSSQLDRMFEKEDSPPLTRSRAKSLEPSPVKSRRFTLSKTF